MKMIQKIALCAVMVVAASTSASTLYWQVDENADDAYYIDDIPDNGYAVLYAYNNENGYAYSSHGTPGDKITTKVAVAAYSLNDNRVYVTDLGSYGSSSYSFYVELVNSSGTAVYTQYSSTYDTLVSSGYVSTSALSVPTAALNGGYNGASVPEPTSGLLLLMGASLLALRRRRQA